MKYVGDKDNNIEYKKRPGAYAIIVRREDSKIGIVTDGIDYFFLGGGIENGETSMQALERELIEESGYLIKNVKYLNEIGQFLHSKEKGFLNVQAYVYVAEFDKKIKNPIEKDHKVLWVDPEEYVGKLYREWQRCILQDFIKRRSKI